MKKIIFIVLLMMFSLGYSNSISSAIAVLGPESPSCTTTSTDASDLYEGDAFIGGYKLTYETLPYGEVKISCELIDAKMGLVAYLFQKNPFAQTPMSQEGSRQVFTTVITGQTEGAPISYAVKFAYEGGAAVTKYVDYVVGNDCELSTNNFQLSKTIMLSPNPAKGFINIDANQLSLAKVEFYTVLGNKVLEVTDATKTINIQNLSGGIYLVKLYTQDNKFAVKKLIIE